MARIGREYIMNNEQLRFGQFVTSLAGEDPKDIGNVDCPIVRARNLLTELNLPWEKVIRSSDGKNEVFLQIQGKNVTIDGVCRTEDEDDDTEYDEGLVSNNVKDWADDNGLLFKNVVG